MPGHLAVPKLEQYRPAGITTFFVTNAENPFMLGWDGRDGYRYDAYDAQLAELAKRLPAIRFIVQVGARPGAPYYWCVDHPDDLVKLASGQLLYAPSLGSETWATQSAEAIRRLVEHFEAGPLAEHIVGYNPVFITPEWHGPGESPSDIPRTEHGDSYGDYSPVMRVAFRRWLNDETAELPTPEEKTQDGHARAAAYFRCYNELNARLALRWAAAIKAGCGRRKLVGLMHGMSYGWMHAAPSPRASGHCAVRLLLESPDIDFLHAPYVPVNRGLRGSLQPAHATGSVRLHGKKVAVQLDTVTHAKRIAETNVAAMMDSGTRENVAAGDDGATSVWESVQLLKRDVGATLARGAVPYWLEYRQPVFNHWWSNRMWCPLAFDVPELQEAMRRLREIAERCSDGEPVAEVAVITDPESDYTRSTRHAEELRQKLLPYAGAPFEDYLRDDVGAMPRYRVCLAAEDEPVSSVEELREKFRRAGVHLYTEAGDVVYANSRLFVHQSITTGTKEIRLRAPARVHNLWTRQEIAAPAGLLRFSAAAGEVHLLELHQL